MNMIVRRHDPKKKVNKISYLTFQNCFNSFSCQKHNLKIKQLTAVGMIETQKISIV